MRSNIFCDDALPGKCRRAAGADTDADFDAAERGVVEIGQAGRSAHQQALAFAIKQQYAAPHGRLCLLYPMHNSRQNNGERFAISQQLDHPAAGLFLLR